jgi:polyhydroxyalkanoate synthesis regulator phasin
MKQATDHAVAWQKNLNDMMRRALSAAQVPSRSDSEHLVALVRGMEERLMAKLEDLGSRVERLERRAGRSQ